jgi:diadenosine tetraphosphate (Ap4A) HIT family hydrolase
LTRRSFYVEVASLILSMKKERLMPLDVPEIDGLTRDQVFTLAHCRTFNQYKAMIDGYRAGKCPFCDPLGAENEVIRENELWRMWHNLFPLNATSIHLILAPRRHVESQDVFGAEDFSAMGDLFAWARGNFRLQGGGFIMRFGTPEFCGGTVLHLHANIIVPDSTGAVRMTLAKQPEEFAAGVARIAIYEKLRFGETCNALSPVAGLSPQERALIEGRV